jgi:hypothetical protein
MPVLATGSLGTIGTILPPVLAEAAFEVGGLNGDPYCRGTFSAGGNPRIFR